MNLEKLKQAELAFLHQYPGGFHHPDLLAVGKKHKMDTMIALARDSFSTENVNNPEYIVEQMVKIIGRSSMVSMFEKPKFRDFAKALSAHDVARLASGLEELLSGEQQSGFEMMLEVLRTGKLAKWSLMTICPVYFNPDYEVFVKPTTAKGVIDYFELEPLQYKPAPTWAFYDTFRATINQMKAEVDASLSPNNAAFTGFLMMSLENRSCG
ncbi:MAG: hypothetical protein K0U68_14230 [Gammaproteobacteria bacterium]|nr:hypothetical protein [Gammaproteobacteria bacterium]